MATRTIKITEAVELTVQPWKLFRRRISLDIDENRLCHCGAVAWSNSAWKIGGWRGFMGYFFLIQML
jgi:hypothetical protein